MLHVSRRLQRGRPYAAMKHPNHYSSEFSIMLHGFLHIFRKSRTWCALGWGRRSAIDEVQSNRIKQLAETIHKHDLEPWSRLPPTLPAQKLNGAVVALSGVVQDRCGGFLAMEKNHALHYGRQRSRNHTTMTMRLSTPSQMAVTYTLSKAIRLVSPHRNRSSFMDDRHRVRVMVGGFSLQMRSLLGRQSQGTFQRKEYPFVDPMSDCVDNVVFCIGWSLYQAPSNQPGPQPSVPPFGSFGYD